MIAILLVSLLVTVAGRFIVLAFEAHGLMIMPRLVMAWARLYTRGLSENARRHRLAELETDIHEHVADARAEGYKPEQIAFQILTRFLVGLHADISWRIETQPLSPRRATGRLHAGADRLILWALNRAERPIVWIVLACACMLMLALQLPFLGLPVASVEEWPVEWPVEVRWAPTSFA